jgi:hypothetical protein
MKRMVALRRRSLRLMARSILFSTGVKPELNRNRRTTVAMIAARCQVITTMHGATGKNAHVAMNNSSAAIAKQKNRKNKPVKLTTKETKTI